MQKFYICSLPIKHCKVCASKTHACDLTYEQKIHLWSSPYLRMIQYILNSTQQKKQKWEIKNKQDKVQLPFQQNS
jgi:aspartate carbamoyltransferase catalytic subunit